MKPSKLLQLCPNLTNCDIYTPYAGPDGILLFIKVKFTMGKLKLSLLSYTVVQKIPSLTEIPMSKYETVSPLSVVFLSINSDGYYYVTYFILKGRVVYS